MKIIPKSKLPKNTTLSKYLQEKAIAYVSIQLYGIHYYFPFTKEMKKVFHIKKMGKFWSIPNSIKLEHSIRDIIGSIYLQIRDTIGSEIHQELDNELRNTFSTLFENYLEKRINKEFQKKLPHKND